MANENYDSASSTGSHASYTEYDGTTEYPVNNTSHSPTGSDTPQQLIIDEMHALQWHEPDDDFANSAHIIDLKKHLDRAWQLFDYSEQYLADINAVRAACAWLMCTLLQANFAQAHASPPSQQNVMDLINVVERIKDKLTAVERKTFRNEKDIRSAFLDHSGKMSVNLKDMSADLSAITEVLKLANKQQKEMNDKIDSLERQVNHIQTQAQTKAARKKKWPFYAEMPPETHTLPALLQRLGRPDTP